LKLKLQTVAEKTAKNFRGLLYFTAPGRCIAVGLHITQCPAQNTTCNNYYSAFGSTRRCHVCVAKHNAWRTFFFHRRLTPVLHYFDLSWTCSTSRTTSCRLWPKPKTPAWHVEMLLIRCSPSTGVWF